MSKSQPVSRVFGFDRGTPIDRYYIENFLEKHRPQIQGHVLEVGDSKYTRKFGSHVQSHCSLQVNGEAANTVLVGDLTDPQSLPSQRFDCFICTQTLNVIYQCQTAVQSCYQVLKPGGVLLGTEAGLCQISRYDMQRWGDYWRFTTKSAQRLYAESFGADNVEVHAYGNVLAASALLYGYAAEEFHKKELDLQDEDYQVLITIRAVRR